MEDILTKLDFIDQELPVFTADDIQTILNGLSSSPPSVCSNCNDVNSYYCNNSQQQVDNPNSNLNGLEGYKSFQDKMPIGRVNTGQKLKQRALVFPIQKSPATSNVRQKNTQISDDQLIALEKEFLVNKYLERIRRIEIAKTLNLSESQIQAWFQKKRRMMFKNEKAKNISSLFARRHSLGDLRKRRNKNKPPSYSDHVAGIQQMHASYINSRPTSYTDNEYNNWAPYCYPEAISYSSTVNQKNSPNYPGRIMENNAYLPKNILNPADNSNLLDQNLTSSNPTFNEVTSMTEKHHTT